MSKEVRTLDDQNRMRFDIRQTNIAKGVALLMLLWHHLFYSSAEYYQRFTTMHLYKGIPIESTLSNYCKVCVAVFLLLSGYGLYMSWQSYEKKVIASKGKFTIGHQLLFVKNHLLKLMFNYWFIYILFVPLSVFFGTPFWEIYKGNFLYGLVDFLGLANLFKTPSMNGTWWFMSVIILFYLLFPLMMFIVKRSPGTLLSIAVFLTFSPVIYNILLRMNWFSRLTWIIRFHTVFSRYYVWLIPFVIGMVFARYALFEKIQAHNTKLSTAVVMTGSFLIACVAVRLYLKHKVYFDGVITKQAADHALERLEIDELGLDKIDHRMLRSIIENYNGGPVGLETLAATIGEEAVTLEDVYEPYLMQIGFLTRTPRGRCVTQLAYDHLGIPFLGQESLRI